MECKTTLQAQICLANILPPGFQGSSSYVYLIRILCSIRKEYLNIYSKGHPKSGSIRNFGEISSPGLQLWRASSLLVLAKVDVPLPEWPDGDGCMLVICCIGGLVIWG